ncbi:MAG: WD40 repeat domain-containing protein [Candidatus Sericytochromatia bacterium]|nr:WD40 repeat domain-containing protein [Candidatus Sericytochromatia bacterium]
MDELRIVKKTYKKEYQVKLEYIANNTYQPYIFSCELLKNIQAHNSDITSTVINENKLLSSSDDKTIKIWDLNSGDLLNTLIGHTGSIHALTIHNDKIISGANDKTIKIWDLESGKLSCTILGHNNHIYSVIGYDDKFISSSLDRTIKIWSLEDKKILVVINLEYSAWSLAISNDRLVAGLSDGTLKIYDISSGSLLSSCKEHEDSITSISIEENIIITVSKDRTIKIWNSENLGLIKNINAHNAAIWSVISNKNKIITSSDDKTIKIFDMDGNLSDSISGNSDWIGALAQTNGKLIAGLGNGTIKIWSKKPKNNCDNINFQSKDFEKSPFDTEKEALEKKDNYDKELFNKLIDYDYINIGKVQIIAEDYSLENKLLPIKITISCQKILDFSKLTKNFISKINIDNKDAEDLHNSSIFHNLYIKYYFEKNKLNYELSLIFIDKKYILDLNTKTVDPSRQMVKVKSDRLKILNLLPDRPKEFLFNQLIHDCNSIDISDTFRTPFEEQTTFENRVKDKLINYGEINIGKVNLVAEKYNVEEEIFPVQVNVSCEKILNLISLKKEFSSYSKIDRYKSKEIYEKSKIYNLYINFVEKNDILFYRLMFIYNETKYFLY